jgi:hypothetical protein
MCSLSAGSSRSSLGPRPFSDWLLSLPIRVGLGLYPAVDTPTWASTSLTLTSDELDGRPRRR